jgi:hypothetical protein
VVAVLEGLVTIYIVSAGRSGSGWLSSVLAGCGLSVVHEWTPFNAVNPDVVSNTEWLWNREAFLASLTMNDVVIVLDRDREAREASVNKLLGEHDWNQVNEQWERLNVSLLWALPPPKYKGLYYVDYKELFSDAGYDLIEHALRIAERDTSNLRNMWDFMRHMRVTNNTVEQMVKESYGL